MSWPSARSDVETPSARATMSPQYVPNPQRVLALENRQGSSLPCKAADTASLIQYVIRTHYAATEASPGQCHFLLRCPNHFMPGPSTIRVRTSREDPGAQSLRLGPVTVQSGEPERTTPKAAKLNTYR
jgi:hypothetical protein